MAGYNPLQLSEMTICETASVEVFRRGRSYFCIGHLRGRHGEAFVARLRQDHTRKRIFISLLNRFDRGRIMRDRWWLVSDTQVE
jgi:hypothetical protein